MFVIAEIKNEDGKIVTILTVPEKEFKTGSKGYFANSKVDLHGKKYQLQVQLVEIGSKKHSEAEQEQ